MQDKTQVFPLAQSDYIRTRLTHSIEVASIGESIFSESWPNVSIEHWQKLFEEPSNDPFVIYNSINSIVRASCLAHDIGNPPFGHSGEDSIRNWFKKNQKNHNLLQTIDEIEYNDFTNFDGNAQTFRILTKLANHWGLGLKKETLQAVIKYPWTSSFEKKPGKFNIFRSEINDFENVSNNLYFTHFERHPLASLLECADDCAYHLIDFQDGFSVGYIPLEVAGPLIENLFEQTYKYHKSVFARKPTDDIELKKSDLKHYLTKILACSFIGPINAAAVEFSEQLKKSERAQFQQKIPPNILDAGLRKKPEIEQARKDISRHVNKHCFNNSNILKIETGGSKIIGGLLTIYIDSANTIFDSIKEQKSSPKLEDFFNFIQEGKASISSKIACRTLKTLPIPYFKSRDSENTSTEYQIIQTIVDYICGMTDNFALRHYNELDGRAMFGVS